MTSSGPGENRQIPWPPPMTAEGPMPGGPKANPHLPATPRVRVMKSNIHSRQNLSRSWSQLGTVYIVPCQRGGVSNEPPGLQTATRHRARDP